MKQKKRLKRLKQKNPKRNPRSKSLENDQPLRKGRHNKFQKRQRNVKHQVLNQMSLYKRRKMAMITLLRKIKTRKLTQMKEIDPKVKCPS